MFAFPFHTKLNPLFQKFPDFFQSCRYGLLYRLIAAPFPHRNLLISPDGGRGAYGWCSINEIWNASGEKYRGINLCAEYLDRPIFELAATLLHEMAHLYNLVHSIQDVSNNGYYHNQKFRATAEAHGLHIEKHAKYGWTVTTLAPEAEAWIRETLAEDKINASRLPVEGTTKGGSKKSINRSIKYVCPCCGTIIRATREVNVICGDCGEAFERE